jgi:hypothetical protein
VTARKRNNMKKAYKVFTVIYEGEDKGSLIKGMKIHIFFDREHIKKIYHAHRIHMMAHYIDKNGNPVDVSFIKFIRDKINISRYEGRAAM